MRQPMYRRPKWLERFYGILVWIILISLCALSYSWLFGAK